METQTHQEIISWKEAIRTALKSPVELQRYAQTLGYDYAEFLENDQTTYPLFLPQLFAKQILSQGPSHILWKQFIPDVQEWNHHPLGLIDPIGDRLNFVAPQLIHRYRNRILFLPTHLCPVQCRYCFRKNELHDGEFKSQYLQSDFYKTLLYLKQHTELEEIIFTGGDPLFIDNEKLSFYLEQFAKIPHIQFIRFHTRFPTIIPQRIDHDFMNMITHYAQRFTISLMVHTNHHSEWFSVQHQEALQNLNHLPIHLGSQTVLLKYHTLEDLIILFKFLIKQGVKPYYLHHPDKVQGAMHFYLEKSEGIKLYQQLRQYLPGWAIPHYVVDSESGHEKQLVLNQT